MTSRTHDDLLGRLREAKGSDRELDEAILQAVGWYAKDAPTRFGREAINSHVTASLDAALALVERALGPEWYPCITRNLTSPDHPDVLDWSAELYRKGEVTEALGHTAPLAILIALLTALPDTSPRRGQP